LRQYGANSLAIRNNLKLLIRQGEIAVIRNVFWCASNNNWEFTDHLVKPVCWLSNTICTLRKMYKDSVANYTRSGFEGKVKGVLIDSLAIVEEPDANIKAKS
jgi:hypothetical protein